ncbi:MAG: tyrosine-type recombinase/integrase [Chitinivibrionales bacterium]|nr:tyrosine-type recombinase/integrase [Chitinivibrionales bacterium]MBD3396518.1 tyrosine-type recombinase/integrase [Chitinivibrionales bacterium]
MVFFHHHLSKEDRMTKLRREFIDSLQSRGLSPKTIRNYVNAVRDLSRHYGRSPCELASDEIVSYQLCMLREKKLSAATVNLHMDAVRTFFRLMLPESRVMVDIPHVKVPKRIPVVLSRSEVQRMIELTTNLKHKSILMLLYGSGLRVGECAALKPCHIESSRMKVRVEQGKGKKDRYTLLSNNTLLVLQDYYRRFRPKQYLFVGHRGKALGARMMGKAVQNAARRAGINKRVHAHVLRHCFATHLLEAGVALPIIQQLLGHDSIKTTMIYLHVGQAQIDRVVSPLDMEEVVHA